MNDLLAAVHLTIPLGGNVPVASGAVTTGAYWIGTLSANQADYNICGGYENAFTWFNATAEWGYLCEEVASDAVSAATVVGVHSAGLEKLGFLPPDELSSQDVANEVLSLLNTPVTVNGSQFVQLP